MLDWEVGGIIVDWDKVPEHAHFSGKRWHLLRAKGKPLGQYGLDLFLGSLANGSRFWSGSRPPLIPGDQGPGPDRAGGGGD